MQIPVIDLGRRSYDDAYQVQLAHHAEVLAVRESGHPEIGRILLVEHDPPVITVSRRPGARDHLLADEALLARHGVTIAETDRGGDITYHGPGQLVVYPILDLNFLRLGLHDYMRLLEAAVIDCCEGFGIHAERDPVATGVWVPRRNPGDGADAAGGGGASAKICAMGVRVRRWVSMHGLALNMTTKLAHFQFIVPCGLSGRPVTSLAQELDRACPTMDTAKSALVASLCARLLMARETAVALREVGGAGSDRISGR